MHNHWFISPETGLCRPFMIAHCKTPEPSPSNCLTILSFHLKDLLAIKVPKVGTCYARSSTAFSCAPILQPHRFIASTHDLVHVMAYEYESRAIADCFGDLVGALRPKMVISNR